MKILARVAAAAVLVVASLGFAQAYPDGPVRVIVPTQAGNPADIVTRILCDKLSEILGARFFVENRPGAFGEIAFRDLVRAAPDGYTLGHSGNGPITILPAARVAADMPKDKIPYDPIRDLEPINFTAYDQFVFAVPRSSPFRSSKELVDYARAHPDELAIAAGTPSGRLAVAFLNAIPGVRVREIGSGQGEETAYRDIRSGEKIDGIFSTVLGALPKEDIVRPLALVGGTRTPLFPNVPTMVEEGFETFDARMEAWYAFTGPKGLPKPIIEKLSKAIDTAVRDPRVQERLAKIGITTRHSTTAVLSDEIARQYKGLAAFMKENGVKLLGK